LTGDRSRPADLRYELVARQERVTLHWHGVNVPNAENGVAGVTQESVAPGQSHTYRFIANRAGTYWYQSHPQVLGGAARAAGDPPGRGNPRELDAPAVVHTYGGARTINGHAGEVRGPTGPGRTARIRVTNTDNAPVPVWVTGAAYRVVAVDGTEVNQPAEVAGQAVLVTAGGRADLAVTLPADGTAVRVEMPNSSLVLGEGVAPRARAPREFVDLLTYGVSTGNLMDPAGADRTFDYVIGRRYGLYNGKPGLWWTINGGLFPNVPMYLVEEGDRAVMRIRNDSGEVHPMHLHGHHLTVLSRNGRPATGSPWIVDSLNVAHGESYEVAFVADNPGIWMDHCHNLPHAREGLMTHLAYAGYTTPYVVGGDHHNAPE
jgi:FtsP/CotA-like multicopper oxidase with cupredoxin domain